MFVVDVPSIDYLTLTTFNNSVAEQLAGWLRGQAKRVEVGKKRMQYEGSIFISEEGACFVGVAVQKGAIHALFQCSGFWADSLYTFAQPFFSRTSLKCTRIDLQVTINYDRNHYKVADLADTLRGVTDRPVSYIESYSGEGGSLLATCYVGSRQSDRFVRIYEKQGLGEDVYLRFEVEFKGARAMVVAQELAHNADRPGILLNEIDRISPMFLVNFRRRVDGAEAFNPQVVKPEPATAKWLREQVAPALDRFLSDHSETESSEIRTLLLRILDDNR